MGLGLAALVLALTAPVEAAFWGVEWDRIGIRRVESVPGVFILLCFLGVWLVSAWFFGRLLGRRLDEPVEPRGWFRVTRSLVGGFPGLGLTSLPVWRSLAVERPRWAYGARSAAGADPTSRDELPSSLNGLGGAEPSGLAVWLGGLVVLLLAVVWLAAPHEIGPRRRIVLIAVAVGLHALGLVGSLAYVRTVARRGASRAGFLFAGCWLLPQPLALLAFVPLVFDPDRTRQETLAWTAYARHNQPGRLGRWAELEQTMRRSWLATPWWRRWSRPAGRRRRPEMTSTDRQLLRFGGIKLSLLLVDGVALGWIALRFGGHDLGRPPWLGLLIVIVLVGVAGGIVIVLGGHLAAAVRLAGEPRPLGVQRQVWSLSCGIGWSGLGLLVGAALAREDPREAGLMLVYGAVAGMLMLAFGLVLQVPLAVGGSGGFDFRLSWCGLFFALMVAGGFIAAFSGDALGLVWVALAIPLWHGLFLLVACRPLESCLGLAGGISVERGAAGGWKAVAVQGTAALPLGGLAVPWWLWLRERRLVGERRQS